MTLTVTSRELSTLRPYPGNARRGDVEAIAASLARNGQFRPLVVQASTSYVLAGNHTMQAAALACVHCPHTLAEHQQDIPPHDGTCPCPGFAPHTALDVTELDVDDEAARRIVVADNRTSDLGGYDDRALLALLRDLGEDLSGTGFDLDDYDDLLASIEEADADNPPQEPTVLLPYSGEAGSAYGEGGSAAGTNVRQTPSYAEYQAAYATRATRFLALIFPLAQYAWVVENMAKLSADRGLDSNSALLLDLVSGAVGEAPPAEDATISEEAVAAAEAVAERASEEASPQ